MKRIKAAAIRQDGVVYDGFSHSVVIIRMVNEFGVPPPITGEQGFITDDGEFLNREDAAREALASGQIPYLQFSDTKLFSEDINYPPAPDADPPR